MQEKLENYTFDFYLFGIIIYIHYFSIFSGDDEDSANQKRKRILQSQRPVDSDGNGFGSDELFSKYALCYKFENSQIFSKKNSIKRILVNHKRSPFFHTD